MECVMDVETYIYKHKQGSTKGFDDILSLIKSKDVTDESLLWCLKSIKNCVTLLEAEHEYLVGAILKMDWTSRGSEVCDMYEALICSLVCVHTDYLKAVLRMIIKRFMPSTNEGVHSEEKMAQDLKMFQKLHSLMQQIVALVPMSTKIIMPLLIDLFPFMLKDVYVQECYLQNLFFIVQYIPRLRQQVLELIIAKLLKMDVQLPKDEILRGEIDMPDESGVFDMEEEKPARLASVDTLDVLMMQLFRYLESTCFNQGVLDWDATKRLYKEMLFVFEKIILSTHGSHHIQFVLFYFCSLRTEMCDGFLDYLWKYVQNPNMQAVFRQDAVSYIGSLLARGTFVSIVTVMNTIELMMSWLHSYTKMSTDTTMANFKYHGPFYCVCQTVFYVFAFRQKEIFNTKKGLKWAESLQFQHLVQSRLNPLKLCLPIIVDTFASITRQHQLAFCDHIIQQNKRQKMLDMGKQTVLESYFPFDPYLLEQSAVYIKKNYRDYDRSVQMGDSDSSDDDDDDDDEEDIFTDEGMMTGNTDNSLTKSMLDIMEYGTSPGFSQVKHKT